MCSSTSEESGWPTEHNRSFRDCRDGGSTNPADTVTYGYTQRDQLSRVGGVPLYGYDSADNMTTQVIFGREYNAANQLTEQVLSLNQATTSFTYDPNGNRLQTNPGAWWLRNHSYDQANRLTSVSGAATGSYGYNGDGLRTSKTTAAGEFAFTWDLGAPLPMALSDGHAASAVVRLCASRNGIPQRSTHSSGSQPSTGCRSM